MRRRFTPRVHYFSLVRGNFDRLSSGHAYCNRSWRVYVGQPVYLRNISLCLIPPPHTCGLFEVLRVSLPHTQLEYVPFMNVPELDDASHFSVLPTSQSELIAAGTFSATLPRDLIFSSSATYRLRPDDWLILQIAIPIFAMRINWDHPLLVCWTFSTTTYSPAQPDDHTPLPVQLP
jgi:hypothetical protein